MLAGAEVPRTDTFIYNFLRHSTDGDVRGCAGRLPKRRAIVTEIIWGLCAVS